VKFDFPVVWDTWRRREDKEGHDESRGEEGVETKIKES